MIYSFSYKGYAVDYNIYNTNEYSIQIAGDDYIFETIEEVQEFIDTKGWKENEQRTRSN